MKTVRFMKLHNMKLKEFKETLPLIVEQSGKPLAVVVPWTWYIKMLKSDVLIPCKVAAQSIEQKASQKSESFYEGLKKLDNKGK